jgi:hypothetical protein
VLSNRIWSVPQSTRAGEAGTVTVFYRCGSQQGKAARAVPATLTEDELTALTVDFVAEQITQFRAAKASKQKNATRHLKKYVDSGDIRLIEESDADDARDLARSIVTA